MKICRFSLRESFFIKECTKIMISCDKSQQLLKKLSLWVLDDGGRANKQEEEPIVMDSSILGGVYVTRTRDPLRDRQVF